MAGVASPQRPVDILNREPAPGGPVDPRFDPVQIAARNLLNRRRGEELRRAREVELRDSLAVPMNAEPPEENRGCCHSLRNCCAYVLSSIYSGIRMVAEGIRSVFSLIAYYICCGRYNAFAQVPIQSLSISASRQIVEEAAARNTEANLYPGFKINFANLHVGPLPIDLDELQRNLQGQAVEVNDLLTEFDRLFPTIEDPELDDEQRAEQRAQRMVRDQERMGLRGYVRFVNNRHNSSSYAPGLSAMYFDSMTLVAKNIAFILRTEFNKETQQRQLRAQADALRERGNIPEADRLAAAANAIVPVPRAFREGALQELSKAVNNCDPRKRDDTLRQYRFLKIGLSGQIGVGGGGELLADRLKAYSIFLDLDQATKEDLLMETYPSSHSSNTLNFIRSEVGVALGLDCDPINVNDPYRRSFAPVHRVTRQTHREPEQILKEFAKLYTPNRVIPAMMSRINAFRNAEEGSYESAIENKFMSYIRSYYRSEVEAGRVSQEDMDAVVEGLIEENLDNYTYKLTEEGVKWIYTHFRKLSQEAGAQRPVPLVDVREIANSHN